MNQYIDDYLSFLDSSVTSIQATSNIKEILMNAGFKELQIDKPWQLKDNSSYYTLVGSSSIFAFTTGQDSNKFRIIGSHSDSPTFKIKPNHIMPKNGYAIVNTEVYGGPILSTWLDRDLSIAGRVFTKGDTPYSPVVNTVDIKKPILYIPNMAIHLNREINKGYEYNPQVDMLPILGLIDDELNNLELLDILAKELNVDINNILDYDLYLYPMEKASLVGSKSDLIASARQDNLSMAYSSVTALTQSIQNSSINVVAIFDHEEIGSTTTEGANSPTLEHILERIYLSLGNTYDEYLHTLKRSFVISADMAHAVHPNHPDKTDATNNSYINKGPVIKYAANMAYTSDGYSGAVFKELCNSIGVKYQIFSNRSDMRGGSTIGPITASRLGIPSVDIGNPLLAMHSARELGGVSDQIDILKVFKEFFK